MAGKAKGAKKTKGADDIQPEISFETGTDEFFKALSAGLGVNLKRLIENALTHDKNVDNVALGMLNDARSSANLIDKLAIMKAFRADDIATDREWNIDEQGYTAEKILGAMQDPAIAMSMATAIAQFMANQGKSSE